MKLIQRLLIIFYLIQEINTLTNTSRQIRLKRVSGEKDALRHSKPWVAFLEVADIGDCHAFLINVQKMNLFENTARGSSDILLTAAHCFVDDNPTDLLIYPIDAYVYLGKHNISIYESHEIEVKVSRVIIHSKYYTNHDYDIAMLKLEKPVKFNDYIKPIALSYYPLDVVGNCSVSGWAGSQNGGLKTVQLPKIEQWNLVYAAPVLGTSKLEDGDSGGAVVCSKGPSLVVQGIVLGADETTNLELFTNVVDALPWISAAFDIMIRPEFFNPTLYTFDHRPIQNTLLTYKLMQYYIEGLMSHYPNFLEQEILFDRSDSGIHDNKIWLNNTFKDQGLYLKKDIFYLHRVIGYMKVQDAHQCVELCYKQNNRGTCTYWVPFKRCYVSLSRNRPSFEVSVPHGQVVRITYPDTDLERKSHWSMAINNEEATRTNIINSDTYKPTWNVSIQHNKYPFHCTGRVVGVRRDSIVVEASVNCLWELSNDEREFKVYILDSNGVHVEQVTVNLYTPYDVVRIPVSHNAQSNIVNADSVITDHPIRTTYEPLHGAFIRASKMPWFIRFRKNDSEKCIGVLLNERELSPSGRMDRTRFILTSARCAQSMRKYNSKMRTITAGVYFGKLAAESARKVRVKNIFIMNSTQPTESEDIAVLELHKDIIFDSNMRPISLARDSRTVYSPNIFMIDWNLALHVDEPMYVIPMKIISKSSMFILSTKRLYSKGKIQLQATGSPLIACKRIAGECSLLGYWSEKVRDRQTEKFIMVRHKIPWIRSIIDRTLKNLGFVNVFNVNQ